MIDKYVSNLVLELVNVVLWTSIVNPEVPNEEKLPLVLCVSELDKKVKRWKNRGIN